MIQIIVINNKESRNLNIEPIWLDDTASMAKQKISAALNVSTEEMYLYVESTTNLSPQLVYAALLKNKNFGVRVDALKGYCKNITPTREIMEYLETMKDSDPVPYDFFERVFNENSEYQVRVPLGLVFTIDPANNSSTDVVMPTNPYDTPMIKRNKFIAVSTNEETILSKLPAIYTNPILYVCTATETIEAHEFPSVGELVSLYFPKLEAELPNSFDARSTKADYLEKIGTLKKEWMKKSDSLFKANAKYYKNIHFWNNLSLEEMSIANRSSVGITNLTATYMSRPTASHPLPLEYIFKSLHATQQMPFIRYIISKRREQMIRLYAPEEAMDDKRIPVLPRSMVNKIIVKSKKSPGIGVFSNHFGEDIYLFLELKETGEIQVQLEAPDTRPVPFGQLNEIGAVITKFVNEVNEILKQTDIILTHIDGVVDKMNITAVDWIFPVELLNHKETFTAAKAKLGCSVFLPEAVMTKEQGKKEKDKGPAKTKEKAAKLKTEMSFVYTRISNFSVDMPEELQTRLLVYYSVDAHQLYMKITNLPQIKYLQTLPRYVITFIKILTNKEFEKEYTSEVGLSTYGYHKQKGEKEIEDILIDLQQKAKSDEEEEEEEDEMEKFIQARMLQVPEAPEKEGMEEEEEEGEELGEFELDEGEDELGEFELGEYIEEDEDQDQD